MRSFISIFLFLLAGFGIEAVAQEPEVTIPDTIFAGTVRLGECDSIDIPILNAGSEAFVIDTIRLGSGTTGFALSDAFSWNLSQIDPDDSHFVRIRFCPDILDCFADSLFVEISSLDGTTHRIYRVGIGGCSGIAELKADKEEIVFADKIVGECDEARLVLSNPGSFPLSIQELKFGNNAFLSDPTNPPPPFTILSGEEQEILLRFCPKEGGEIQSDLTIISDAQLSLPPVRLRGRGLFPRFGTETEIDFGDVPVGSERDTILVIRNLDPNAPLTILQSGSDNSATDRSFTVETVVPPQTKLVMPGDTAHLHLSFHPIGVGEAQGQVLLMDDQGLSTEILLKGTGLAPGIRLDTAFADAGEIFSLTVIVDGAGELAPNIEGYRLVLQVPPFALFPKEVLPAPGSSATMEYEPDGRLTIEGENDGRALPDGKLLRIAFRALSTGDSLNRVIIEEAEMTGLLPFAVTGEGLAILSGCDIGRSAPVSRKLLIRSVAPNPIPDQGTVTYRVPAGSNPILRMYGIDGDLLETLPLPQGNGNDQSIPIRRDNLLPGYYILELDSQGERDAVTILIEPKGG